MFITDFLSHIMAPTYEVSFEINLITGEGYKIQESPAKMKKCYEFLLSDNDNSNPNSIKLVPKRNMKVEWLCGPAVTLEGKQVIYPCARSRCVIPCPCLLCRKKYPCCSISTSQHCNCVDCIKHFRDHSNFHATFHFGCRACYQIVKIFPAFNFFFLNNVKKQKPSGFYYGDCPIKPIIVNVEPEAPKRYLDYLPASIIMEQHGVYGKQGVHCIDCDIMYWSIPQLREHIERNHLISKVFEHHYLNTEKQSPGPGDKTCKDCGNCFLSSHELNRHVESIHRSDKFTCDDCGKQFTRQDNLLRHIDSFHETYICDNCKETFSREDNLKRHKKMKHIDQPDSEKNEMFKCELCTTTFTIDTNLQNHVTNIYNSDGTVKNACNQCEKNFCTGKQLTAHIISHHRTFTCERCQQNFTLKQSLILHIKTRKHMSCNQCGNPFCNITTLKRHKKDAHDIHMKIYKN